LTETNITPRNVIGQSATQTGAYNNIGGTRTATTVLSQTITSLGYFVIGTSGYLNAGTYTDGTGQNYENLTAVSDELRAKTLAGNVVFELTANYSSATETYPIVFDSFAIEGGYWTVTIKPASGVQTLIEGSNSTAIFNLNGVQRLIIDGSASSRTNDLTISNTNTSGCAIRFINGACYNTVKNCIVKAVNDAGELGGAIFFATSATGIGNNYNTIDNCDITCGTLPLRYGIRMSGSSSPAQNNGNVIKNCRFVDFKVYGVGITANTINTTITECEFYNTVPQDGSQHDGIYISAANIANTNITRNKFYDFMSASTLTSDRMRAINLSAGTTNGVITIANNFISLGDRANNPNVGIFAIRDGSGTNSRSDIYYNSIYIGGTGITSTAQSSAGYSREYATNTNFKNNIVFNNRTNVGLGPGKHYCIFASSTGGTFNSDYNDLYCADDDSSYIGYWTSAQKTLEDWQNATSQDANSISRNPEFLSTTNLHINPYSSNVNRRGTPIAGISLDIDGETRNDTFPDIGADEYTPIPTYTITANAYGGGSIIPSGEIVIFQGEDTTFIITPNSNHHLDSLLVDGVNHGSDSAYYRFENVNANHTIDAYFSINTYTITATATSGGTITPSGNVIVAYGEDTTFYITPDPNYQIDDVLVDAVSIGPVTQYTFEDVTTNHTIHAIFSLTTPPPSPGWTELESMPTGVALKYVKNGGALTSATEPGEKVMSLYAFRGNKSNEFKKYYQGAWTDVETIGYALKYPVTDSSRYNKKKPDKGAALCFDGNHTIYATKGAGTFELWRYDLDSAHWYFENWLPSTKGAKGGTSLFYKGGLLYVLVGGQKLTAENFFAYDPINKLWATLQKAPAGTTNKMWKDGSAIVAIGETIFGLKGSDKYNSFWVYDITTNNWSEIESCPKNHPSLNKKNTVKDGGAMCTDGSVIYMIKGNGKQDFWKYTPTTNAWTPLDTIRRLHKKSVPKTGAGLAYANGRVYLLKGNNTPEFWQYGITEMSNVKVQMSNLSTATENSELRVQNSKLIEINPNPITQFTTIRYTVPISGKVSIRIYNAEGRLVKNLLDEYKNVGYYLISMSAKHFTSGVYFLRYNNNDYQQEIKLIIQ
ncbi:MAG: T9SS type A sorting domain-containing protein, partial [candidate division WOR-3 bacterium]|nr:T9SS type A sorting domain-containing protein [candidate division WOR-3 bacterium]